MGYGILSADSAEEALERLESDRVDILFSDVVMPGLSGVELAKVAREKRPDLPVLLASGYSDEILAGAGACFEFVRKPYDAATLDRAIQTALDEVEAVGA
jgi:DNA-binding NtrC family response regulator